MNLRLLVPLLVLTLPLVPAGALDAQDPSPVGLRAYALVMDGNSFNLATYPDTPLLEAYLGELVAFAVAVPLHDQPHTFHLHGHPWFDEDVDRFIDAKLLRPGEVHTFTVTAGGQFGEAGDWLYHCHMDRHFEGGMFGIFRVYPYAVRTDVVPTGLEVRLDRLGEPLDGATLSLTLDGEAVPVTVEPLGEGRYAVAPRLPTGATGALVVHAVHEEGASLARLALGPGGISTRPQTTLEDVLEAAGSEHPLPGAPKTV